MDITFISSLYKTDKYIVNWKKSLLKFADEAKKLGFTFEVIAIANDPEGLEDATIESLKQYPWFMLAKVPRESLYASWNRGVDMSHSGICTFWNVDDVRFADAVLDGIVTIRNRKAKGMSKTIVYFPFIYKRYVRILGIKILAKRRRVVPMDFDKEEFIRSMHSGPFFMFSKEAYDAVGSFDAEFKVVGDFEWCARAASDGVEFIRSKNDGGIFTNDGSTLSGSKTTKWNRELLRVYKKYGTDDKYEELKKQLSDDATD